MVIAKRHRLSVIAAVLADLSLTMSGCIVLKPEEKDSKQVELLSTPTKTPLESKPDDEAKQNVDKAKPLDIDVDYTQTIS